MSNMSNMFRLYLFYGLLRYSSGGNAPVSAEQRLYTDLFKDYEPVVRPVIKSSDPVQVSVTLQISKIDDLSWYDERLTWNPVEYDGVDKIVVPPTNVWLPAFTLDNTLNPDVYIEAFYKWFRVTVENDGSVWWEPGGQFISKCSIEVTYYPFDAQKCELIFANWVYSGDVVNLTVAEDADEAIVETYTQNGEWELIDTDIFRDELIYDCCPVPYPEVHFVLYLKRRTLFYLMNIVLPSVLLSLLVLVTFRLPPDSGEKMSMDITLLLSYVVFILLVYENVPNTSQGVPLIVIYLLFSMGLTSLSILAEVLVLSAHLGKSLGTPPECLMKLARRITGFKFAPNSSKNNEIPTIVVTTSMNGVSCTISTPSSERDTEGISNERLGHIVELLSQLVKSVNTHIEAGRGQSDLQEQWKHVAMALDVVFFWMMLMIFILGMMTILVIIPLADSG